MGKSPRGPFIMGELVYFQEHWFVIAQMAVVVKNRVTPKWVALVNGKKD